MNVFLQICIEDMFQQTRKTMIVFRRNEDQSIGPADRGSKLAVLERFAGVIHADRNFPGIDQFDFDIAAF